MNMNWNKYLTFPSKKDAEINIDKDYLNYVKPTLA